MKRTLLWLFGTLGFAAIVSFATYYVIEERNRKDDNNKKDFGIETSYFIDALNSYESECIEKKCFPEDRMNYCRIFEEKTKKMEVLTPYFDNRANDVLPLVEKFSKVLCRKKVVNKLKVISLKD